MNGARHQLFASAAFAADQHGGIALGHLGDEVLNLAHAFAFANQNVAHVEFGLQAAILVAQIFQGESVFQRDRRNSCNRAEEVDVIVFKLGPGAGSQEVKHADRPFDCNQRNAKHTFGFGGVGRRAAEYGGTLPKRALDEVAAQTQRGSIGRLPVPGGARTGLVVSVTQNHDGAVVGGNHFAD